MKKSLVVLLHLGFWACYSILIVIILGVYNKSSHSVSNEHSRMLNALMSLLLFAFIPSVVSYFLYYFILFPKYLQQKKFFLSAIYGILISAGAALVAYILQRYLIETGRLGDMDEGGKNGRSKA